MGNVRFKMRRNPDGGVYLKRTKQMKDYDVVSALMDFESGLMEDTDDVIILFQHLVDTGMAWHLQGSYGRLAESMIDNGVITHGS